MLSGTNHLYDYVDAFSSWNGLADGLAYNRLTGDLYASSDIGGVYQINRSTGAIIQNVGNNAGSILTLPCRPIRCQTRPQSPARSGLPAWLWPVPG